MTIFLSPKNSGNPSYVSTRTSPLNRASMVERRVYNTDAESKVMQGMRRRKVKGVQKGEILETRGVHTLADTGPLGQL